MTGFSMQTLAVKGLTSTISSRSAWFPS